MNSGTVDIEASGGAFYGLGPALRAQFVNKKIPSLIFPARQSMPTRIELLQPPSDDPPQKDSDTSNLSGTIPMIWFWTTA